MESKRKRPVGHGKKERGRLTLKRHHQGRLCWKKTRATATNTKRKPANEQMTMMSFGQPKIQLERRRGFFFFWKREEKKRNVTRL